MISLGFIEEWLFRFINELSGQFKIIDGAMIQISLGRNWIVLGAVLSVLAFRLRNERLLYAIILAVASLGISDFISFEIVKPLVARERPCWLLMNVKLTQGYCGGSYGFTSNHAANAFAVWFASAFVFGYKSTYSIAVLTAATLIAISRVYLGGHFVGDILGGAVLGVCVSWSACVLGLSKLSIKIARIILRKNHSSG